MDGGSCDPRVALNRLRSRPGCRNPFCSVGSSAAIEIFNISPDANGVPTFVRTSGRTAVAVGAPSAMSVVNTSLYVAGNGGSIAEYSIDP